MSCNAGCGKSSTSDLTAVWLPVLFDNTCLALRVSPPEGRRHVSASIDPDQHPSLDQLGLDKQALRDCQTQRTRYLHIDDKLEAGRELDGQLPRAGAAQDAVDINSAIAKLVGQVGAI